MSTNSFEFIFALFYLGLFALIPAALVACLLYMRMKRKDKFDWILADLVKAYSQQTDAKILKEMDTMRIFAEDMNVHFTESFMAILEPVVRRETSAVVDKVVAKRFEELCKRLNGSLQIQNRLYMQRFIDADKSMMKEVRDAHNNMVNVFYTEIDKVKAHLNGVESDLTNQMVAMGETLESIADWQKRVYNETADVMSAMTSEIERLRRPASLNPPSPAYVEDPSGSGEVVAETPPPQRDWTFPTPGMVASGWLDDNQVPEDMRSLIPVSNVRSMSSITSLSSVSADADEEEQVDRALSPFDHESLF
ncbi:hypothetical protein FRC02_002308 [Tulasnella sp. 418]|nr:hypothetical protein FRC02_002308 [Tulasnella sp. 418]